MPVRILEGRTGWWGVTCIHRRGQKPITIKNVRLSYPFIGDPVNPITHHLERISVSLQQTSLDVGRLTSSLIAGDPRLAHAVDLQAHVAAALRRYKETDWSEPKPVLDFRKMADELITQGYRRVSNLHRMLARIDRPDWLEFMAKEMNRTPADFMLDGSREGAPVWKDHYRRVYSKDTVSLPREQAGVAALVPFSGVDDCGYVPRPDGWQVWEGGTRPVEFDTYVEVRLRSNERQSSRYRAGSLRWDHIDSQFLAGDIVAWRLAR